MALPYGTHGLLGAAIGATAGEIASDDPQAIAASTLVGLGLGNIGKPAAAWAGMHMRNYSEDFYTQGDLKDATRFEQVIGNKPTSVKRNLGSALKTRAQQLMGIDLSNATNEELLSIKNRSQLEDLQLQLNKTGANTHALDYFNKYKNNAGPNATPEEAFWYNKKENALIAKNDIDNQIAAIERKKRGLDYRRANQAKIKRQRVLLPDGTYGKEPLGLTDDRYIKQLTEYDDEIRSLKRRYDRMGEIDRKYRHEIAKSEGHAMWANKNWSKSRLEKAGYRWEGAYKWGDVKDWMRNTGAPAWEHDINQIANKAGVKNIMLNDNTSVNLLRNVNVQDNKAKRKPSRVFQRMGRDASYQTFINSHLNASDIKRYLKNKVKTNPDAYKFTIRDLRDYGEGWKQESVKTKALKLVGIGDKATPKPPAGMVHYNKWLEKYLAMSRPQQRSAAGRELFRKMTIHYGNNQVDKIVGQMKTQGAFRKASRGRFQLSGIGRVTSSYLEGGINATSEFIPFVEPGRGKVRPTVKVAQRMITSDLSDLPFSGSTGIQRNIPFIVEEEWRTYSGRTGGDLGGKMTRANPFADDTQRLNNLRTKQLTRGEVKHHLMGDHSIREKTKHLQRQIMKNKLNFTKYVGKRLPGVVGNLGLFAWAAYGILEGEKDKEIFASR